MTSFNNSEHDVAVDLEGEEENSALENTDSKVSEKAPGANVTPRLDEELEQNAGEDGPAKELSENVEPEGTAKPQVHFALITSVRVQLQLRVTETGDGEDGVFVVRHHTTDAV